MSFIEFNFATCGIALGDNNDASAPSQRVELKSSDLREAVVEPITGANYLGQPFENAIVVTDSDTGAKVALLPGQHKPADIEGFRAKASISLHHAA